MVTNVELAKQVDFLRIEVEENRKTLALFNSLYEEMKAQQEGLTQSIKPTTN